MIAVTATAAVTESAKEKDRADARAPLATGRAENLKVTHTHPAAIIESARERTDTPEETDAEVEAVNGTEIEAPTDESVATTRAENVATVATCLMIAEAAEEVAVIATWADVLLSFLSKDAAPAPRESPRSPLPT